MAVRRVSCEANGTVHELVRRETEADTARVITTPAGTILGASPGAAELLGMPARFLTGKPLVVFTDPEDYQRFFSRLHDVMRQVDRVHTWAMQLWPYRRPACDAAVTARVRSQGEDQDLVVEWTVVPRSTTGSVRGLADRSRLAEADRRAAPPTDDVLEVQQSELEAIRRTYVAALAHELLTPLTVIQGYADTLQSTDARGRPDSVAEAAAAIADQVTRLRQLATNVLDGARASTGLLTVAQAPVLLSPLVDRALQHFRARTHRHRFIADIPRDLPPVLGDHDRLTNVLHNLLSNAVKYAPDGGRVWVRASDHSAHVELSVEDEGIGIAPVDRESVFEPYYRTRSAIEARIDGVGLGLHICKAIVDAHGGRIWVESAKGRGSAVHFTVPRANEGLQDP